MQFKGLFFLQNVITLIIFRVFSFWTTVNEKEMCVPRQRLQQWSAHILERLDEDARHKPFEIHDYGSKILSSFGEGPSVIGSSLKFREVTASLLFKYKSN